MADSHLANYNRERSDNKEFTVESYKKETGMSLPHLYLVTRKAKHSKYQIILVFLGKMTV